MPPGLVPSIATDAVGTASGCGDTGAGSTAETSRPRAATAAAASVRADGAGPLWMATPAVVSGRAGSPSAAAGCGTGGSGTGRSGIGRSGTGGAGATGKPSTRAVAALPKPGWGSKSALPAASVPPSRYAIRMATALPNPRSRSGGTGAVTSGSAASVAAKRGSSARRLRTVASAIAVLDQCRVAPELSRPQHARLVVVLAAQAVDDVPHRDDVAVRVGGEQCGGTGGGDDACASQLQGGQRLQVHVGGERRGRREGRLREPEPVGAARAGKVHDDGEPPGERRIDVLAEVARENRETVEVLQALQQESDLEVGPPVGTVLDLAALAEQRVRLVEEQHGVARLSLAEGRV